MNAVTSDTALRPGAAPPGAAPASQPDPAALIGRLEALLQAGRTGAAKPLLAALRKLSGPDARLSAASVRLSLAEGRHDAAALELDAAILMHPEHAELRLLRAELRLAAGDSGAAAGEAAEAIVLAPDAAAPKAVLGLALLDLGRTAEARTCLAEALRQQPENAFLHEGLAAACEADGDPEAARCVLADGIAVAPGSVALRRSAVLMRVRAGDFAAAVTLAEAARAAGVLDACLLGLQGHALSSRGEHEAAQQAYADALALGPDDPYVRHMVTSAGLLPSAPRAPAPYLRAVFNGYAERFDRHLLSLEYRVPGLIRAAVLRAMPELAADGAARCGPVLDLGCGTGLLAVVSADLDLGPWTGVDVAAGMLEVARSRGLYDALHEADIIDFLSRPGSEDASDDGGAGWRLIMAGDVLCYFGALETLFAGVRARLCPGGHFVCSAEALPPEADGGKERAWRLGSRGRYAHALAHITACAATAGLHVEQAAAEPLRKEAGMPVEGFIVVLSRPR